MNQGFSSQESLKLTPYKFIIIKAGVEDSKQKIFHVWLGWGDIQYLKTWQESMILFILIISAYVRFNRLKRKTMRA